jgi:hypothetical protein
LRHNYIQKSSPSKERGGLHASYFILTTLPSILPAWLRVIDHSLEIDDDYGFIADYPRIVAWWYETEVAGFCVELCAVIHLDSHCAGNLILEMRGFAAIRVHDGLDRGEPSPSGLKGGAAYRRTANIDEFETSLWELAHFIGLTEMFYYCLFDIFRDFLHVRKSWLSERLQNYRTIIPLACTKAGTLCKKRK